MGVDKMVVFGINFGKRFRAQLGADAVRLPVSCKWLPLLLALLAMLPQSALALSASQVYEQVKDSVVVVKAYDQKAKLLGLGSGVRLP
jgi:hypothetical protein